MPRKTMIRRVSLALYGLGAFLFFAYWAWAVYVHVVTPTISKVILSGTNFKYPTVVNFPYLHNSLTLTGNYNFDITIFYNEGEKTSFHILPDDCLRGIKVNGQPYTLSNGIDYCDYQNGFTIDFHGLLRNGSNNINISVEDVLGGLYGLNMVPEIPSMPSRICTMAILFSGLTSFLAGGLIQFWRKIKQDHLVLAVCLVGSVLFRLPYFWLPGDWDEGAFIMLGRDLLQGNLPYVATFENKPPLVNVFYAFFLIFADSLPGIRLMIALYLGVTTYVIYKIGVVTNFPRAGMLGALFSLLLFSVPYFSFNAWQSFKFTFTEHIASLPLALMLYYLLKPSEKMRDFLLIGLCCAFVALIRTNMIIIAPFVALILLVQYHKSKHMRVKQLLWFSLGVVAPYVLLVCIYASIGHLKTLIDSMVLAPIAGFADAGVIFEPSLISQYMDAYLLIVSKAWDKWSAPIIGILAGIACILCQKQWSLLSVVIKMLVISVGVLIATVILVHNFDHYMLQLVIPVSLLVGFSASALLTNRLTAVPAAISIIFAFSFVGNNMRDGISLLNEWNAGKQLQRDAVYKAGEFIRQQGAEGDPLFSSDWAELPFYTNAPIVTMHVFPQTGTYEKLNTLLLRRPYSIDEQAQEILLRQPRFIAYRNNEQKYDLLVNSAKNQGYQDVIDIDGIRLLESR